VQGKRSTPWYKFRAQSFYTIQKLCDAPCRRPQRTAGCADANPSFPESLSEQTYFRMSILRVEIHAGGEVSVWRARTPGSEHEAHKNNSSRVVFLDDWSFSHVVDEVKTEKFCKTRCRAGGFKSVIDWLEFGLCGFCIRLPVGKFVLWHILF
jgi:hypothetical protein